LSPPTVFSRSAPASATLPSPPLACASPSVKATSGVADLHFVRHYYIKLCLDDFTSPVVWSFIYIWRRFPTKLSVDRGLVINSVESSSIDALRGLHLGVYASGGEFVNVFAVDVLVLILSKDLCVILSSLED
jgi:hypothetical protein